MSQDSPRADARVVLRHMGIDQPCAVQEVHGGRGAQLWKVTCAEGTYALRLLGEGLHPQARREVTLHRYLENSAIPVPAVVAETAGGDPPGYLMQWADGRTLAAALLDPTTDRAMRRELMRSFGRLQARMHELPGPVGMEPSPWLRPTPTLAAQVDRLDVAPPRLLHLDHHPLNVLVREGDIVAVLDWANAATGDPRLDRARTLAILDGVAAQDPQRAGSIRESIEDWAAGYGPDAIPPAPYLRWARDATRWDLSPR